MSRHSTAVQDGINLLGKLLLIPGFWPVHRYSPATIPATRRNALSRSRRRFGPTPGTSSSVDVRRAFARRARWPVMAKRCASSRICWISAAPANRPAGRTRGRHRSGRGFPAPACGSRPWPRRAGSDRRPPVPEHLLGHGHCPAIHQENVGHLPLAVLQATEAAVSACIAAVVVAGRDAFDVVAAIVRFQRPFRANTTRKPR